MNRLLNLLIGMLVSALLVEPLAAQDVSEMVAVRQLLLQTFDKPDAPLTVEPITIEANVAVAGWAQSDAGGRALLRRAGGQWRLVLCSGDALKDVAALRQFGLSPHQAETLASAVAAAEANLDPSFVAKLSRFDGVVMMDDHGNHPPTDAHRSSKH